MFSRLICKGGRLVDKSYFPYLFYIFAAIHACNTLFLEAHKTISQTKSISILEISRPKTNTFNFKVYQEDAIVNVQIKSSVAPNVKDGVIKS